MRVGQAIHLWLKVGQAGLKNRLWSLLGRFAALRGSHPSYNPIGLDLELLNGALEKP